MKKFGNLKKFSKVTQPSGGVRIQTQLIRVQNQAPPFQAILLLSTSRCAADNESPEDGAGSERRKEDLRGKISSTFSLILRKRGDSKMTQIPNQHGRGNHVRPNIKLEGLT